MFTIKLYKEEKYKKMKIAWMDTCITRQPLNKVLNQHQGTFVQYPYQYIFSPHLFPRTRIAQHNSIPDKIIYIHRKMDRNLYMVPGISWLVKCP